MDGFGVSGTVSDRSFKVVIHFDAEYGQIEYDETARTARVILADEGKRRAVEKYLNEPHVISNADGDDLRTFHPKTLVPTDDLASFKLALTRLWHHTGIYVDWSRPPK